MFGYSEEEIAQFGLTFGVSAFMLYMVFIIFQLARESKAGKLGTFILLQVTNVIVGLRVTEEEEREGLDVTQHGERVA